MDNKLNLPVTRKALFFDCLKNRFGLLFKSGLVLLLFFIPIIALSIVFDQFVVNLYQSGQIASDGTMTSEASKIYTSIELYRLMSVCISVVVFSIGLSGIIRIFRQMCWSEGVLFWDCFKKGVSQNVKNYIAYALIFDVLYASIKLAELFSGSIIAFAVVTILVFLVFIPILIIALIYSSIYNASFLKTLKNASILAIKNYPFMLLLSLLVMGLLALSYIPVWLTLVKQGIFIIVVLLVLPLFILLVFNLSNYIFDKDINTYNHPEMLRKGLY